MFNPSWFRIMGKPNINLVLFQCHHRLTMGGTSTENWFGPLSIFTINYIEIWVLQTKFHYSIGLGFFNYVVEWAFYLGNQKCCLSLIKLGMLSTKKIKSLGKSPNCPPSPFFVGNFALILVKSVGFFLVSSIGPIELGCTKQTVIFSLLDISFSEHPYVG